MRQRATAVVIRNEKVLLVRDRGKEAFSLPGGGIHKHEPALSAAARELYEETSLRPLKAQYAGVYDGSFNHHIVFVVEAEGDVRIRRKELSKAIWWDGQDKIRLEKHVQKILELIPPSSMSFRRGN